MDGLITFSLLIIEAIFVFDFILVLATEIIGLGTLVWIRFIRFPPILRAHEQRLAGSATSPSRSSPIPRRRSAAAAARAGNVAGVAGAPSCRSRSSGSASAIDGQMVRRARSG